MYVCIWRFEAEPGREREFERVYGPRGEWARLFSGATGFLGTRLLRESSGRGFYVTIDRWISEAARLEFMESAATAYRALDERCGELTRSEVEIGSFEAV